MMNWIDIIDRAFSLYRGYFRCFFGTISCVSAFTTPIYAISVMLLYANRRGLSEP